MLKCRRYYSSTFRYVDGVLNYESCKAYAPSGCMGISDSKVKLLGEIIKETGAKVVLSSDWKLDDGKDYQYLVNKLKYKANVEICDKTPNISWSCRGKEITAWLTDHADVDGFVILDDIDFPDFIIPLITDHIIITDYEVGLTREEVKQAVKILNGDLNEILQNKQEKQKEIEAY